MKYFIAIIVGIISHTASADIRNELRDCEYSCSARCENLVLRIENRLDRVRESCGFDNPRNRPPRYGKKIEFYANAFCSSQYQGSVRSQSQCTDFASTVKRRVSGIKVDGKCENIQDMPALAACLAFSGKEPESVVKLYNNAFCSTNLVAFVDPYTDCSFVANSVKEKVSAIKVGNECINISNTDFKSACLRYQNER